MNAGFRTRLLSLKRSYNDRLLTVVTILLLLLMFVVAPLQAAGFVIFEAFGVIVGAFMIGCVLVMSTSLFATSAMLAGFLLNVLVIIFRFYHPLSFDLQLVAAAWLIMIVTLGTVVARVVFGSGPVSFHRVIGAVLLYLLIAMTFVSLFVIVDLMASNAFNGFVLKDSPDLATTLIYFSFVTLTSTGYGDIVPVHPLARSLCNIETIIGQLYPATLLARLVTLELQGRR